MSLRIITDSAADLSADYIQSHKVTVIPMRTIFGEQEYIDGVTITKEEFYEKLIETDEIPTTSQLTPYDYQKVFEKVRQNKETALVITVSKKLSGTYSNANIAASEYSDCITVLDSENVSIGQQILVLLAVSMAEENKPLSEIISVLEKEKKKICVIALLDTLEYLKKGGRISATAAMLGSMLQLKPVISIQNGEIVFLGKARGSKKGNNMLMEQIALHGGVDEQMPMVLGYSGLSDHLLRKYIVDSGTLLNSDFTSLPICQIGSIIGTHAGPGGIACAFYKKNQQV